MKLETLLIANRIRNDYERYSESIQQLCDLIHRKDSSDVSVCINTGSGWGMQCIYLPRDVLNTVLPIINDSLIKHVEKLRNDFEQL